MDEASIKRINELAKKKKTVGLDDAEREEQRRLYEQYIAEIRGSLKTQLENTDVQTPDGRVTPLSEFRKNRE